jgi:hypothetical protein
MVFALNCMIKTHQHVINTNDIQKENKSSISYLTSILIYSISSWRVTNDEYRVFDNVRSLCALYLMSW